MSLLFINDHHVSVRTDANIGGFPAIRLSATELTADEDSVFLVPITGAPTTQHQALPGKVFLLRTDGGLGTSLYAVVNGTAVPVVLSGGDATFVALVASGAVSLTGTNTLASLVFDSRPSIGAHMTLVQYDSGITAVNTGGAATTLTLNIPAAAHIVGVAAKVTTAIAGINSTTGTFALTGGSTASLGTISAFSADTKLTTADSELTTDTTNATFTLSGGGDNTPSAGAVRLTVTVLVQSALD